MLFDMIEMHADDNAIDKSTVAIVTSKFSISFDYINKNNNMLDNYRINCLGYAMV